VIIVVAVTDHVLVIFALSPHECNKFDILAKCIASAHGIIVFGNVLSSMILYLLYILFRTISLITSM
jgi:hypothetical protein